MGVDLLRDELLRVHRSQPQDDEGEIAAYAETAADRGALPPDVGGMVAPQGPCAICGDVATVARCAQCERSVCATDLWVMYGLCRTCLTQADLDKVHAPTNRPRPDLGIKWIEDA